MEAIQYEHESTVDAAERMECLRQACMAFLAEPATRVQVRIIALMVSIPVLPPISRLTVRVKGTASSSPVASTSGSHDKHIMKGSSSGSSNLTSSKGDALAAAAKAPKRSTLLRRERHVAVRRCAMATEQRLLQASQDAKELTQWLNAYYYSSGAATQSRDDAGPYTHSDAPVRVVVAAQVVPRTIEDLLVYCSWQTSPQASHLSPLRHAALVLLSLESSEVLTSLSSSDGGGKRKKWNLADLLLPHQSLLTDLTWCLLPLGSSLPYRDGGYHSGEAGEEDRNGFLARKAEDAVMNVKMFLTEVQGRLSYPKGGRSGGWISYRELLYQCHDSLTEGAEDEVYTPTAHVSSPQHNRFLSLHAQIRSVWKAIYGHPSSVGATTAWRILTGFAGPLDELVRTTMVAVRAPPSALETIGASSSTTRKTSSKVYEERKKGQQPMVDNVALLGTRALRDAYALLAVLSGQDSVDLYAESCAYCRGVCHRLDTAHVLSLSVAARDKASLGAYSLLTPPSTHDGDSGSAKPASATDLFILRGLQALGRRRARQQRKRPGAVVEAPKHMKKNQKRKRERTAASVEGASKRMRTETAAVEATATAPLAWAVDV